ncbi:NAD(P)-binding oxidoreductase [Catenulispora subtropica]|uniref:SDR family oxidoreductase n=1 Tax=Catenulispora subtropica TaxID=450798 RepID=A0ABP5D4N2_9ACTN
MSSADSLAGATYLVIGGSGRTGRLVVASLLERGAGVTVAGRRPHNVPSGADSAVVDLSDGFTPAQLAGYAGVVVSVEPPTDDRGSEAVMHRGVAAVGDAAAATGAHVVLVSQIYITRADEYPAMAGIITARARGEEALRTSGARYTIVRPGWLTSGPAAGVRLEQGDTGDGQTSRASVAAAAVAALGSAEATGKTFEIYDAHGGLPDWGKEFATLVADAKA